MTLSGSFICMVRYLYDCYRCIVDMTPGTSASASTVARPTAPSYVCNTAQTHIMCLCCRQPMPDRRRDNVTSVALPPQTCELILAQAHNQ